ncbi:colanic acid/amylovoran biosynthesis protein [Arthrobacter globiformis]|uniref:polysaccharide pyruvyl transferase family protein n=1 Tax=Arthrobacter globiformis TaxID=1665 RepID=UPI0027837DFF|nr:polysaccharide pyruvyl transferase family protein [Arthrobacter globiformis]MDQ1059883.1 colanic acid/amylovoran biosynthesis protein [Arthrobacter globiformis]
MKIVVQGDLGQAAYHVGDEAMTVAAVDELKKRMDAEFVLLSRDPAQTSRLYGVDAAQTVEFPWQPGERARHLDLVRRAAAGDRSALPPADHTWSVIEAIGEADGVLIAGGGNMNSLFGWLLYERAAVALIAKQLGKPLVVSGQTFGPALLPQDRAVLQELLTSATLVGARETSSYALGLELGLEPQRLVKVLDDGSFIEMRQPSEQLNAHTGQHGTEMPNGQYIAATFSPDSGREGSNNLPAYAGVLDRAADLTGLPVYLVPHLGALGAGHSGGDHDSHRVLLENSRSGRLRTLPVLPAGEAASITKAAELVLTNRYHPAVFGLAAGVPVVAVSNDAYSDVRLHGAMENWGLENWALPLPSLASGGMDDGISEVWSRREQVRQHLVQALPDAVQRQQEWWDGVAVALAGARTETPDGLGGVAQLAAEGAWSREANGHRRLFRTLSSSIGRLWTELDEVSSERDALARRHAELIRERDAILSSRSFRMASFLRRSAHLTGRLKGRRH